MVDSSLAFVNTASQRAHVVTSFGEGAPQEGQNDSFIMWLLIGLITHPNMRVDSTQKGERWRAVGRKRTSAAPRFLLTRRFYEE